MVKTKSVKKGGCGCQNPKPDLILKGGAGFDVNNPSVIPFNNYNGDPSDPSQVMSVRMQPNMNSSFLSGGKKRKMKKSKTSKKSKKSKTVRKSKRRTMRRMKKGGADPVLSSQNANITSSFNTVLGAQTSANIITGTPDQIMNSNMKINQEMPFI
jgi:hypothetical protein